MSIPLLRELHEDARRLVIAGAGMAVDDVRLKRFLPQLQQLGEKAPIFKRVVEEVEGVTNAQQENAAEKLLDLTVLLQAVLHTQSSIEAPGELQSAGTNEAVAQVITSIPYRKLKPLLDSLTQRGSGRLDVIRQGVENNLFIDIRTFAPAVNALRDSYAEIADYIADHVIPIIGSAVLPILHAEFNMLGSSGDGRILASLYKLTDNKEELRQIILSAQKDGSQPVRLSAITLTTGILSYEDDLLDLTYDRKKDIRSAALMALSALHTNKVVDRLMDALLKKDIENTSYAIRACDSAGLTERLLQYGKLVVDHILSENHDANWHNILSNVIFCLEKKVNDVSVRQFLIQIIEHDQLQFKEMEPMISYAANVLLDSQFIDALTFLHEIRDNRPSLIQYSFKAAILIKSPFELFEYYERYFTNKKNEQTRELLIVFNEHAAQSQFIYMPERHSTIIWDKRWTDVFIALNDENIVCLLAQYPDEKAVAYLIDKVKASKRFERLKSTQLFCALFKLGYADTPELLLSLLEQPIKKEYIFGDTDFEFLIVMLPSSYAERLRQIAAKITSEYTRNNFLRLIDDLATKPAELELKLEGNGLIKWFKNRS